METKLKRNLAVQVIKDHNIKTIEVIYSGGGDDGCIDEVNFTDHNEEAVTYPFNKEVESTFDDLLYDILNDNIEWDWINNDGGCSTMMIDCTTSPWSVKIDHTQRTTEDYYYDKIDFDIEDNKHSF